MRPFLIGILIFITLNVVLGVLAVLTPLGGQLDYLIGNKLPDKLTKLTQLTQTQPVDIIALGTSVTHHAFAAPVFDATVNVAGRQRVHSFNMGIPASNMHVLKTYLAYHMKRFGKPKLVVLEVTDTALSPNNFYMPAAEQLTLMAQDPTSVPSVFAQGLDPEEQQEVALLSVCSLCRYQGLFAPLVVSNKLMNKSRGGASLKPGLSVGSDRDRLQPKSWVYDVVDRYGWEPISLPENMKTPQGQTREALATVNNHLKAIQQVDLHQLAALLAMCKANDISVVMVKWPRLPQYMALFRRSPLYPSFNAKILRLSRQYQYPVIDLTAPTLPKTDPVLLRQPITFENTYHLEGESAAAYTQVLAHRLVSSNVIKGL